MTRPRRDLIRIESTPYYHLISRCVRRTFLCGVDKQTGRDYEHRKQWVVDRIRLLSSIFNIDICSYAVMSNHYHIVVKLNPSDSCTWTNSEVIKRWRCLYKGPTLIQRYLNNDTLHPAELTTLNEIVSKWRERLSDLSWFMKCLNEFIAKAANKEDQCKGHFWESRFTSKALPTESALIACMAYVDLNPIRAKTAKTLESSEHTSIYERTHQAFDQTRATQEQIKHCTLQRFDTPLKPLLPFKEPGCNTKKSDLPITFSEYLKLLEQSKRMHQHRSINLGADKPAFILKSLLARAHQLLTGQGRSTPPPRKHDN